MTELDWIEFLRKKTLKTKGVVAGIGDDCAVIRNKGGYLLLTSDMSIDGIHFRSAKMKPRDIGRRAAARAMSDIVACGGVPKYLGVSCALPGNFSPAKKKEIFSGIEEYCRKYKVALVGGDTAYSRSLFLDIWVVGEAGRYILRSKAGTGDQLFLTGRLGSLGFDQVFDLRVNEVQSLLRRHKITSMIDISDGFSLDLHRLLKASGKGALVYGDTVPVTRGRQDLFRGEDYELLFTVDKREDIKALKKKYFHVGEIKDRAYGCRIISKGKETFLKAEGYVHF